jgi:hypothetical protein
MPAKLPCPSCSAQLNLPDHLPEKVRVLRCPSCKGAIPLAAATRLSFAGETGVMPAHEHPLRRNSAAHPPTTAANSSPHASTDFDPFTVRVPRPPAPAEEEPILAEDAFPAEEIIVAEEATAEDEIIVAEDANLEDCVIQEEVPVLAVAEEEVPVVAIMPEPPKVKGLLGHKDFLIQPRSGAGKVRYEILDGQTRDLLGIVAEEDSRATDQETENVARLVTSNRFVIREAKHRNLLCTMLRRPYKLSVKVDINDFRGGLLGHLVADKKDLLNFRVLDKRDGEFALGRGQWRPKPACTYQSPRGHQLGAVTLAGLPTGVTIIGLHTPGLSWHLSTSDCLASIPNDKLLLLASVVAFDLTRTSLVAGR